MLTLSFSKILIDLIMNNNVLKKSYNTNHPNQKYKLNKIVDEIIYVLKTGISWRNIRSTINWNTLYHHYKRFVEHDIFKQLFF